jgi:hypothetical protein
MYFYRKLKPSNFRPELLIELISLPVIVIIIAYWGIRAAWGAIAIIEFAVVLMHLNMYFRTKNKSFLWLVAVFLVIVIFAVRISAFGMNKMDPDFIPFVTVMISAFFILGYIVRNKKIKWRTREILELAAMPVVETGNGFTDRPLAIGKIDASAGEIESFARFLSENMIAMPYRESGRIIFSLPNSYWKQYGFIRGYNDESWVSFSENGHVNVYISRNDYLLFRDNFSFDQLCANMGQLFIEFFEMYKKGEGIRIADKLNALNLNPVTE